MPVMRITYTRESTDVTWPWEVTGDPGSAEQVWGDDVRQRMRDTKALFLNSYGATNSGLVTESDLVVYTDTTFPDTDSMNAYEDYVNTDPDWVPAVPSTFQMTKTVTIDP